MSERVRRDAPCSGCHGWLVSAIHALGAPPQEESRGCRPMRLFLATRHSRARDSRSPRRSLSRLLVGFLGRHEARKWRNRSAIAYTTTLPCNFGSQTIISAMWLLSARRARRVTNGATPRAQLQCGCRASGMAASGQSRWFCNVRNTSGQRLASEMRPRRCWRCDGRGSSFKTGASNHAYELGDRAYAAARSKTELPSVARSGPID